MKKQLQFELWQECNSLCKFCYLGHENRFTPDELKINSIESALEIISNPSTYNEYDVLSYLGGEFFQGQMKNPEVKTKFMELMKKTAELLENGTIRNVWIYATMTIGEQKDLYETLKLFNKKEGLWILTSYDTKGRFHTPKMEENWDYHMRHIHELYPEIRFNITSILSEDLIDKYLDGRFSFKDMMEKYHCAFFLKQCGKGNYTKEEMNKILPNFFPPRNKFIKFLRKFRNEESDLMWTKLFDIHYRADMLYRNHNIKDKQMESNPRFKDSKKEEAVRDDQILPCGHLDNYQAYIDSDKCCLCDKIAIGNMSI